MSSCVVESGGAEIRWDDLLKESYILVQGAKVDGFGDVIATFQLGQALKDSGVPPERLFINVIDNDNNNLEVVRKVNAAFGFALWIDRPWHGVDVVLTILSPARTPFQLKKYYALQDAGSSVLMLNEYNKKFYKDEFLCKGLSEVRVLGLGEDLEGIFIYERLRRTFLSEREGIVKDRLSHLLELSFPLKAAILRRSGVAEFQALNRLYYGYSFSMVSALEFVAAIAAIDLEKEMPGKNLIIYVAKPYECWREGKEGLKLQWGVLCDFLKDKVGIFEIKSVDGRYVESYVITEGLPKQITLILGSVDYGDGIVLMQASEDETIATGDLSVSEVISAAKSFIYEVRSHKAEFAEKLKEYFLRMTGVDLDFMIPSDASEASSMRSRIDLMTEVYRVAMRDRSLFRRFSEGVVATSHCGPKIAALVASYLARCGG